MELFDILKDTKVIAIVGCSHDEAKASHRVAKFLKGVGYKIIPINPTADVILGEKVYKSLDDVPVSVDIVDVFRPAAETLEITKQAVKHNAKVVWLQEGIVSEEAKEYAARNGIEFVQDRCTMKVYKKMVE